MCIFYFTLFAYSNVQALYYQLRAYLLEKREMDDGQGGETDALRGGGGGGGGGGGVVSQGDIISSAQHASDLIVFLRQTHPLLAAGIEAILQEVNPPLPLFNSEDHDFSICCHYEKLISWRSANNISNKTYSSRIVIMHSHAKMIV